MDFFSSIDVKREQLEGYYYCTTDLKLSKEEPLQIFLAESCSNTWRISKQPDYSHWGLISIFAHLHHLPYFLQSITAISKETSFKDNVA